MIWIMKPNARTGTIMVTIGRDMNSHPMAKRPSGAPKLPVHESMIENELMVRCSRRKMMRNSPLILIISFLPMEDVKMFAISISVS